MKTKKQVLPLLSLILLNSAYVWAQDWSQWRGPNRDGVVANFSPPADWKKAPAQKWKTNVGEGYSSPVIYRSRAYVHTRRDSEEVVSAIDLATGSVVWSQAYPAPFTKNQYAAKMSRGPFSTPLVHQGNLYTLGATGVLSCFGADQGKLKWRKDYSQYADTSKLFCGIAMSPIVDGETLIVHVGDDRKGWVIAFGVNDGKEKWRWEGDGPGYASPIIVNLLGTRQLVTLTDKAVVGLAAETGKLLWRFPHPDEWNENIITPVLYRDTLIISGVRQGTRALKVTKTGDTWSAAELWRNEKIAMYMSSPVLDADYLYGLSTLRKGQYFCVDARTGATLWTTEGRDATNAAVLAAKDHLLFLTDGAELIVAARSLKGFEPLGRYTVAGSPTWSHPVVFGKQVLIKDEQALILWSFE